MNIKQVKYFISVADSGSLSAAAREHGISVQAMSKAMVDLEKDAIHPLLERSHQGVELTVFGKEFYKKAQKVNREFCDLEDFVEMCHADESRIKAMLCAPSFLNNGKALSDIESFIHRHLSIDAEISIGTGEEGLAHLSEGTVDTLVTIGLIEREGIDCTVLGTIPTGICVAKNHPLARKDSVTLDDIRRYPVIFSQSFDQFNESVLVTYTKCHDGFNIVKPNLRNMREAVKALYIDHCVCFMAVVSSLGEMVPFSKLIPIAGDDQIPVPICFITLSDRKTPAYMRIERLFTLKP